MGFSASNAVTVLVFLQRAHAQSGFEEHQANKMRSKNWGGFGHTELTL
jgi:hypothetical protein